MRDRASPLECHPSARKLWGRRRPADSAGFILNRVRHYARFLAHFLEHILFRMGLRKTQPSAEGRWEAFQFVVGDFTGSNRYIRTHNTHLIPRDHPAIFYGNHMKLDDPFYLFRGVYLATGGSVMPGAMMRSDFFEGIPFLKSRWLDLDQILETVGVYGVSRENVTISQLKRFVDLLLRGKGFILYPGRSRSCSGLLMDYRDSIERPGGISFFLHAVQSRADAPTVSAAPAVRNYNPVTRHTSVIFGPEIFLPRGATRAEQRLFDEHLIEALGPLVEINAAQVVAALLYTRCLHGLIGPIAVDELVKIVSGLFDDFDHAYLDPEDKADAGRAVRGALRYLRKGRMLTLRGGKVCPIADAILSTPPLTTKFRDLNPVKYLTNQILHLGGVTALIEQRALGLERDKIAASPQAAGA